MHSDSTNRVIHGRGGIRTHGTLLTYTHFPGVRLKPLGHPSLQHQNNPSRIKRARARSGPSILLHGQGEIRTLDTLAGTPVFETGAFNHSATCPIKDLASKNIGFATAKQPHPDQSYRSPLPEELQQQLSAFLCQQPSLYFRRMIEPRMSEKVFY